MREARKNFVRFGLALFCIYLIAGGVSLMVAIFQQLDFQQLEWARPIAVAGLSLLIAYLATFVFKEEITRSGRT